MRRKSGQKGRYRAVVGMEYMQITQESIEEYIAEMERRGRVQGTIDEYRRNLNLLYQFLPADKKLRRNSLDEWRRVMLQQGYTPRTINARVSAANSYLAFFGRRDLQQMHQLAIEDYLQPEMTRPEYLRLLQTARQQNKERLYLLIKLFGTTGLPVQALEKVTVAAVKSGRIVAGGKDKPQEIRLPRCLQRELLEYAADAGLDSGPLFVTRSGKPLSRTNVADSIRHLCRDARVPEEKGNPRCLRRLYEDTRRDLLKNITALLDQTYEHLIENEQATIGWAAT